MKNLTEAQVRKLLASAVKTAGGQRAFGREHGISDVHIHHVVNGQKLSPAILTALGLEVANTTTTYRKIKR